MRIEYQWPSRSLTSISFGVSESATSVMAGHRRGPAPVADNRMISVGQLRRDGHFLLSQEVIQSRKIARLGFADFILRFFRSEQQGIQPLQEDFPAWQPDSRCSENIRPQGPRVSELLIVGLHSE